jgi:hypothetical protein
VIEAKAPTTPRSTLERDNEIELTAINLLLTDRALSLALAYAADDLLYRRPTYPEPDTFAPFLNGYARIIGHGATRSIAPRKLSIKVQSALL